MRYARVSSVITALNTFYFRGLWTEIIVHFKKIKSTEHMVHYRRELNASFDHCVDDLVEKWASHPKVKTAIEFCDRVTRWLSDRLERPSKAWYESSTRAKFLSAFEIIRFRRNSAVAMTDTSNMTEEKQLNLAKEYVADIMFKTILCNDFEKNGECKFGQICMFAHGRDELRTTESNLKKCMVENKGFVISEYAYNKLATEYQKIADEAQRKPEVALVERKRSVVERRLSEMTAFVEPVDRSKTRRNTVLDTVYMSQLNASVHNGVDTLDTSQLNVQKKANFDEDASVQDGGDPEAFWISSFLRGLASFYVFQHLLWCTPSPGAVNFNTSISKEIEELFEEVDRRILSNFIKYQPMWFISCWYCPDILWKEKGNFVTHCHFPHRRMIHFFLIVIWALMHGLGVSAVAITRLQDGLTIEEGIWVHVAGAVLLFYIVAVPVYSFVVAIAAYIVTHSLRQVIYTMEKKEIHEVQLAFLEPSDGAEKTPKEEPLLALNKNSSPDSVFTNAAADVALKKEETKMSNSEQLLRNALSPDLSTARLPPLGQAAPTLSPLQGVAVLPELPWTKNMLDLEQSIEDEERKVKLLSRNLEQLHSAEAIRQDVLKMLELSVGKGDPQKDLASDHVSTNEGEEGGKEESSEHSAQAIRRDVLKTLEVSVGEEGSHKDPADDNVSTNKGEEDGGKDVLPEKVLKPSSTKAKPKKKESIPDAVKRKEKLELLRSAQKKREKVLKILDNSVGRPNKITETANVHIPNVNEGPTTIPTSSDEAKMKEIVARIEEIDSKTKLVHDKQKKLEGQTVFLRGEFKKIKDGFESPHVEEHRKRKAQGHGTSEQKMEVSGESTPEIEQQKQHDSSASVQGQNTPERENLLSKFESCSQGTSEQQMEISGEAAPEMEQQKQYHTNDSNASVQRQDAPQLESCSSQNSEIHELIALDGLHLDHFAQSKLGSPLFRSLTGMMDSAENTGDYECNKKKL